MKNIGDKLRTLRRDKQLLRALTCKFLFHTGIGRFLTFKVQGMRLRFFHSEMTYEAWKCPGRYRTEDAAFLEKVLRPGGLVVDVGANVGMISIQAAKLIGPSGRVIAIEPNPRIAAFCKENIELNRLDNVTVMQTALGEQVGTIGFNCDRCDDRSRVVNEGGTRVPLTTLDKIMEAHPKTVIDLLKIDVEGYELTVLGGAREALRRTRWLYIEADAPNYAQYGKSVKDVTALLDTQGFDIFISYEQGNWQEVNGALPESVNLIGRNRNN